MAVDITRPCLVDINISTPTPVSNRPPASVGDAKLCAIFTNEFIEQSGLAWFCRWRQRLRFLIEFVGERPAELLGFVGRLSEYVPGELGGVGHVTAGRWLTQRRRARANVDLTRFEDATADEPGSTRLPLQFFTNGVDTQAVGPLNRDGRSRLGSEAEYLALSQTGEVVGLFQIEVAELPEVGVGLGDLVARHDGVDVAGLPEVRHLRSDRPGAEDSRFAARQLVGDGFCIALDALDILDGRLKLLAGDGTGVNVVTSIDKIAHRADAVGRLDITTVPQ